LTLGAFDFTFPSPPSGLYPGVLRASPKSLIHEIDSTKTAMELSALDKTRLPQHVAIIMDGNGRWAKLRGKSRIEGHRRGKTSVRVIVEMSRRIGIRYLSLYAFSTENWFRPHDEIDALMGLLEHYLATEQVKMMRYGIRLTAVGDRSRLPDRVRAVLEKVIDVTRDNRRMTVILALSYSGRDEIVRLIQAIARDVRAQKLDPEQIDERTVSARLDTGEVPDPDLLIRTSGEMRVSNFLLWQIAYSEIWVTPTLWPDFRKRHLFEAILDFQKRERSYGGVIDGGRVPESGEAAG